MKKLINVLLMLLFFLLGLRLSSTIGKFAPFLVGGQNQEDTLVMPANPADPMAQPVQAAPVDANGQAMVNPADPMAQPVQAAPVDANGQAMVNPADPMAQPVQAAPVDANKIVAQNETVVTTTVTTSPAPEPKPEVVTRQPNKKATKGSKKDSRR